MARARNLVVATAGDLVVQRDPDRPSGRLLRQDDMDASYVDLADPRHLEFDYLRWARLVLRAFAAHRVLHVGGGACSLARAMLAEDGDSRQEVIELDQAVIDVARAHLGLRRQPGLKVRIADGADLLLVRGKAPDPRSADAVVIDAFLGARVPARLVSSEVLSACARIAPVTVVNVVDTAGWPAATPVAAALAQANARVVALSGGSRRAGNVLLIGCAETADSPRLRNLQSSAASDPSPAQLLLL